MTKMSESLWPDKRVMESLMEFADENGQIVFSDAAWPVIQQIRDEMQQRIDELEEQWQPVEEGFVGYDTQGSSINYTLSSLLITEKHNGHMVGQAGWGVSEKIKLCRLVKSGDR